ncbi:MAG TPA: hypothetical protein VIQ97_04770 [Prevotella sp.]
MSNEFIYYLFCLLAVIVGFLIVKKVAGCLIKSVIALAILAILAFVYIIYIR